MSYTNEIYFTFNSGTRTITDYNTDGGTSISIPPTIGGVPVENIDNYAFGSKGLTSVIIPNSVIYIGEWVFYDNSITSLTIGNSVETIAEGAFWGNLLTELTIPNSVLTIGDFAFEENLLTEITIPNSVTSIGFWAFMSNPITSVTILNESEILPVFAEEIFGTNTGSPLFEYIPPDELVVYGYVDSASETYAIENGFDFVDIETPVEPYDTMGLGDVNFNLENIKYRLILCNPQKTQISELTEASNIVYSPRFMDIGELSFTIPYKIDNVKNPNWDLIKGEFLILLNDGNKDLGYFIIDEPSESGANIQTKNIRCFSSEFILAQKRLRSYEVDSISLNSLMNDSVNGVLKIEAPSWTFTPTTDTELTGKFRSFDISDSSLWDFIITEVASSYGCVFLFNTLTNTITAERLENVGENKGLVVSKENFINTINASMKFSDIITKLIVQGKDDTIINEYNILGTMYLLNYDNYRNTDYMSQSLRDALDAWYVQIDNNRAQFNTYLDNLNNSSTGYRKQLLDKQNDIAELKTELANIEANIRIGLAGNPYPEGKTYEQWYTIRTVKIGEIQTATNQYNTIVGNINTTLDNMKTLSSTLSISSNFTEAQQKELDYFTKTDVYSNPYILDPEELIDDAAEFFEKINIPRTKFDIDSIDFLSVTEFQKDHSKIVIGDLINIEYNDFNINYVPVRLVGYDHDEENKTLQLIFSNSNRYDDPYIEFVDGSYNSYNAGRTLDLERYKYNDFVKNNKETLISFTESPIDVSVNSITTDDGLVMDESGTYSRQEGSLNAMRMLYDRIIYTNDNWATEPYPMLSADGLQVIDAGKNIRIIAQVSDELLEDPYEAVRGFVIYKNDRENGGTNENPKWEPMFYADDLGNLTLEGALKLANGELIIDRFGIDPKYIKYFKNMFWNSSFELFDPTTDIPTYWSDGESNIDASFAPSRSMRLNIGVSSYNDHLIQPVWYDDALPENINKRTRVSFYKKFGEVTIAVKDIGNNNAPYTLYDRDGNNVGTSMVFPYNDNWNPDRPTFTFDHFEHANTDEKKLQSSIRVEFECTDTSMPAYIDAVQLEPDFTGSWASFYTDGVNSIPSNPYGSGGGNLEVYIQDTDPTLSHPVGFGALWIDTDAQADDLDFFTASDRTKLDGISDEANKVEESTTNGNILIDEVETNVYTHPANHDPSIISQDTNNRFVTDVEKSTWNGKQNRLLSVITKNNTAILEVSESGVVLCNHNDGFTVTLPSADSNSGLWYSITNTGVGTITVEPDVYEEIQGEISKSLSTNANLRIVSDGSNWYYF